MGNLVLKSRHRLMCGNSTSSEDVGRLMDGQKADCVFTSPPYAVGIDYGEYDDTIENLREMLPKLAELWKRFIVPGGFAVTNFGDILGIALERTARHQTLNTFGRGRSPGILRSTTRSVENGLRRLDGLIHRTTIISRSG